MFVELALVAIALILFFVGTQKKKLKLPPGPRCYPVIGSLVMPRNLEILTALRDEYGDVVRTRTGVVENIHLFNYKTIKELFSKAQLTNRPDWEPFQFLADGASGVIFANGERWVQARRFLLRHLRDLGMGKSYLSEAILIEAKSLVEDFRGYADRPTKLPSSINIAVLNVIWQLVANRRYNLHDEKLLSFFALTKEFHDNLVFGMIPCMFPWLRWLPTPLFRRLFKSDSREKIAAKSKALMKEAVDDHKDKLDPENPIDVIDVYLLEIETQKSIPNSGFTEANLMRDMFDLFAAGFDTTTGILRWTCTLMAAYPEVQKKVQMEIDDVVERDTLPSHLHRSRLVYLEATMHEVHRVASLAAGGIPRIVASDICIDGYDICKGSHVTSCNIAIHNDPRYWRDPEKFSPERFLDESGNFTLPKEGFLPFGIGKRSCLGEALAKMEIYIFSAALLQNFFFSPPENCEVDTARQEVSGSQYPVEQDLVITARF